LGQQEAEMAKTATVKDIREASDYRAHARKIKRDNPKASVEQLAELFYNTATKAMWKQIAFDLMNRISVKAYTRRGNHLEPIQDALLKEAVRTINIMDVPVPWEPGKTIGDCTGDELMRGGERMKKFGAIVNKTIGRGVVLRTRCNDEQANALRDKAFK